MADDVALSVIVPLLDEEEALPALHDELTAFLASQSRTWELVYVDDGSEDGSPALLERFVRDGGGRVHAVTLRRNYGKAAALAAGFDHARGQLLVMLDADGQDVPAEIPKLLAAIEGDGADVAVGWRAQRHDRFSKKFASRMYNAATRALTGLVLHDQNTGLKAFRREVVDELPLYGGMHRFVIVLAHDRGFRIAEVPVEHRPRQAGVTKYRSMWRFPTTLLDLTSVVFLTRFADRPLHLLGGAGVAVTGVGVVVLIYPSLLKLLTGAGIGSRPLLQFGVLATLVGVQLFGLGLLGDAIRHSNVRHETPYRIRRRSP